MKIYIGADHRGFKLKEKIKDWVKDHDVTDEGAHQFDPDDDYTTYASKVAIRVSENENSMGILACGSGVGVDITANKFDGAYASVGKTATQVEAGRKDDNFNILVIAADFTTENQAKKMIEKFLETEYKPKPKYERRLRDIKKIESIN